MSRLIVVRRSPIHGNGVFATQDLPAGKRLIEYGGRVISHAVADRLYGENVETGHTFLFTLNEQYVVDGAVGGNAARWINHSCEPNCEAVLETADNGQPREDRIWIETTRPVARGEELSFNYGITLATPHTARLRKLWECRCGSPHCTGTILTPKARKRVVRTTPA